MPQSEFSRRRFIEVAGGAMVLTAVAPAAADSKPTIFEATYPTTVPSNRGVLVAYASGNGATNGVAEAIGKELAVQGDVTVDVRHVSRVTNLDGYQAVVLGSAIHSSKWLPEAMDFLTANRSRLARVPTAYFAVCMTMSNPTPKNLGYVQSFF